MVRQMRSIFNSAVKLIFLPETENFLLY
uniref:Uncharacterized protein n=1 Tax=Rhizophora mucronata TaxID=61149 RepID=A0A2P2P974_RHIMU